jgi:outer membrane protein OmpA-like peptidoglycan-associated protein
MIRTLSMLAAALAVQAGSPALAQAPAEPVCTRQYIIYFPPKSADTTAGAAVIKQAVSYAGPNGQITVTGHIDGAEREIDALAEARSGAVARDVMDGGVTAERLTVTAAGFSRPAVKSEGAEPLNRRATVCVFAPG